MRTRTTLLNEPPVTDGKGVMAGGGKQTPGRQTRGTKTLSRRDLPPTPNGGTAVKGGLNFARSLLQLIRTLFVMSHAHHHGEQGTDA